MGLKRTKERTRVSPVYLLRDHENGDAVEFVQDHEGLWWFRHRVLTVVYIKGRGWTETYPFEPWYCPEVQPDPYSMPGPRAQRLRKKGRYLPLAIYEAAPVITVAEGNV